MKPWEETWTANGISLTWERNTTGIPEYGTMRDEPHFFGEERLRLAAQAPAMAQRLLSVLNSGYLTDFAALEIESVLRDAGALP